MDIRKMPISELNTEEGAEDLVRSEAMRPYMKLAIAKLQNSGSEEALEELKAIPLEKRYMWRVASALKWALADCDDENVEADRITMSREDFSKLTEFLRFRPVQFCIVLRALFGEQEMLRLMKSAVTLAKQT